MWLSLASTNFETFFFLGLSLNKKTSPSSKTRWAFRILTSLSLVLVKVIQVPTNLGELESCSTSVGLHLSIPKPRAHGPKGYAILRLERELGAPCGPQARLAVFADGRR